MYSFINGIWKDRFILQNLVKQDLYTRYRRSALGIFWAILTPLGLVLIIGSVYSIIFGTDPKTFIPLLFAGLNPWLFISTSSDGGNMAFIGSEGYLKQTNVNAQIFPLRIVLGAFINLLYSLMAFFVVYLFLKPSLFSIKMLMIIPGLFIIFIFSLALANFSAVINVNFRDYQPLQSLIFQGLFYVTPIIYKTDMLKERGFEFVYKLNPFYYVIEVIRKPMLGEALPSINTYLISFSIAIVLFYISVKMVNKEKRILAFKL